MEAVLLALQRAFPAMLRMSLSAAVLTGVVVLLRFLLRKAPKRILCLLWLLVAVRLLCPALPRSGASLMPPGGTSAVSDRQIVSAVEELLPVLEFETPRDRAENQAVWEAQNVRVSTEASPGQYLPMLWAAGTIAMLLYALGSCLRLRQRTAASVPFSGKAYLCDGVDSPFILGMLRPRIYLPSGLEEPRLSHVLAHERAHLRRLDQLWKPLGFLLLALHWFNPVLWLAYLLFCRDMELACDERAVRDLNPEARADYAQALLDLSRPGRMIAACPLAFGETGMKGRVKNVLNPRKPAFWIILGAVVLAALAAVFFLTDPAPILPEGKAVTDVRVYLEEGAMHLDPEAGEELAELIRRYGKRRFLDLNRGARPRGNLDTNVYLFFEDYTVIYLDYRYVSGYNIWNGREADYQAIVSSSAGNGRTEWKMAYGFNNDFVEWRSRWIPRPEDRESAQVYRMAELLYVSDWLEGNLREGIDLLFLPGAFISRYTPETWPVYCVTPEKELLVREDPESDRWTNAGHFQEIRPEEENFHRYYRNVRKAVPDWETSFRTVWRLTGDVHGGDGRAGQVFYDLLTGEDGTYLACGYLDAADPDSADSGVHFLIRLLPGESEGGASASAALRAKYPEYYDLPMDKGLELYVWQLAEGSFSCGLMAGTNREKTNEELWNLKGTTVEEMKEILASYALPEESIDLIPIHMPYSSYMYLINDEYREALRELFFGSGTFSRALMEVSCPGSEPISPYPANRWAETWTGDGWLSADGIPIEATIAEHMAEIPTLELRGEFTLRLETGVSRCSPLLRIYDKDVNLLVQQLDEDLIPLTELEPGTYWVTLGACRKGKYISEQDRYEKTGYDCVFRLVIPEES